MIKSAAIRFRGKVYVGHNHTQIGIDGPRFMFKDVERSILFGGEQGFVTDDDRFVDRREAASIALECGQIKQLRFFADELDSADINYPEE